MGNLIMFKKLISALLLGAFTSAQNCAVCWDGSEAQFTANACVCPAAVPVNISPADDEPLDSNPNCTTGNVEACNRADGFFDFVTCSCAFPPTDAEDDWTPPEGFIDENDEEWEFSDWDDYYGNEDYYDELDDLAFRYFRGEEALYSFGEWSAVNYVTGYMFYHVAGGNEKDYKEGSDKLVEATVSH